MVSGGQFLNRVAEHSTQRTEGRELFVLVLKDFQFRQGIGEPRSKYKKKKIKKIKLTKRSKFFLKNSHVASREYVLLESAINKYDTSWGLTISSRSVNSSV